MKVYDSIAEDYVAKRRKPWEPLLDHLKNMESPSLILDAGSGGGRHAAPLAIKHEVVCLDFSRELMDKAKVIVKEGAVHFIRGDLRKLPFKHECFDAELSLATLHHIPTFKLRLEVLKEILRTLKTGGLLLVSVWSRRQPKFLLPLLKGLIAKVKGRLFEYGDVEVPWKYRGQAYLRFYHLFTSSELKILIRKAGFRNLKVYSFSLKKTLWPQNYVAIAYKT